MKRYVVTCEHKVYDHDPLTTTVYAENEERAREVFKELNSQFIIMDIEECDAE